MSCHCHSDSFNTSFSFCHRNVYQDFAKSRKKKQVLDSSCSMMEVTYLQKSKQMELPLKQAWKKTTRLSKWTVLTWRKHLTMKYKLLFLSWFNCRCITCFALHDYCNSRAFFVPWVLFYPSISKLTRVVPNDIIYLES